MIFPFSPATVNLIRLQGEIPVKAHGALLLMDNMDDMDSMDTTAPSILSISSIPSIDTPPELHYNNAP